MSDVEDMDLLAMDGEQDLVGADEFLPDRLGEEAVFVRDSALLGGRREISNGSTKPVIPPGGEV